MNYNEIRKACRDLKCKKEVLKTVASMKAFLAEHAKPKNAVTKSVTGKKKFGPDLFPKHYKMYVYHMQGKSNKEISELLDTNVGHVWNELKRYKDKPERAKKYVA